MSMTGTSNPLFTKPESQVVSLGKGLQGQQTNEGGRNTKSTLTGGTKDGGHPATRDNPADRDKHYLQDHVHIEDVGESTLEASKESHRTGRTEAGLQTHLMEMQQQMRDLQAVLKSEENFKEPVYEEENLETNEAPPQRTKDIHPRARDEGGAAG